MTLALHYFNVETWKYSETRMVGIAWITRTAFSVLSTLPLIPRQINPISL
jgi:hypothetical protein